MVSVLPVLLYQPLYRLNPITSKYWPLKEEAEGEEGYNILLRPVQSEVSKILSGEGFFWIIKMNNWVALSWAKTENLCP